MAIPIETEIILPFAMQHRKVNNPAKSAWDSAPSNPCGAGACLDPELDVYFHLSEVVKAVVYVFHGGEGSARMWFTGEEEAALIADLVRNRYAVVMVESTHRPVDSNWLSPDPERFDPLSFPGIPAGSADAWIATINADEQLVRDVHVLMGYDSTTEVFLVGFSSGGLFASSMAYNLKLDPPALGDHYYTSPRTNTGAGGLNIRAAAVYNAPGVPFYFGNYVPAPGHPPSDPLPYQYSTPTIFNYAENDPVFPAADVASNADFLANLPTPVPFESNLSQPHRLRADRFARVLGISYAESRDLYAHLVADTTPCVDTNGFVLTEADQSAPVLGLPPGKQIGAQDQLQVLRAEHHVSSQYHDLTTAFFDAHV